MVYRVIPTQAVVQFYPMTFDFWIPACAGMTRYKPSREKTSGVLHSDDVIRFMGNFGCHWLCQCPAVAGVFNTGKASATLFQRTGQWASLFLGCEPPSDLRPGLGIPPEFRSLLHSLCSLWWILPSVNAYCRNFLLRKALFCHSKINMTAQQPGNIRDVPFSFLDSPTGRG